MHGVHHMIEVLIEIVSVQIVMRFPESILYNDIASKSTEQVENVKWLPRGFELFHPGKYLLSPPLNDWLQFPYIRLGEEGIERTASNAMMVVIESYKSSLVCAIQADESVVFVTFSPTAGIDLVVEIWVVDVQLIWTDPHDWPYGDSLTSGYLQLKWKISRLTIFLMHLLNLPHISSVFDHIIVKFIP